MSEATRKLAWDDAVVLLLCGDVMLGRGVDQILPHPGKPMLHERMVHDARTYVDLAVQANGPIPQPVDWAWPWGDTIDLIKDASCDARIINLETSITTSDDYATGKAVHYRMNPANIRVLAAIQPDVCVLANNHVLDFGRSGLLETLDVLFGSGFQYAGAGGSLPEVLTPAVVPIPKTGGRVIVLACGHLSSGIPSDWAAAAGRPGVHLVTTLTEAVAEELCCQVRKVRQPGDVVVVSLHWGSNWGYQIEDHFRRFAHRLIDSGVDLVHGHSSHHPRPLEVYHHKLILYGCGDLVNDYEGIAGHRQYRSDLRLLYLARLDPDSGELIELRIAALQARQLRLHRAAEHDVRWLRRTLDKMSRRLGSRIDLEPDGLLTLRTSS